MDFEFIIIPPLAAFVLFGIQWVLWGQDPKGGKDTVAINTDPPDDLSVIECGVLYDDVLNDSDISLELLNLYFKKIVEIREDGAMSLKADENSPEFQALTDAQVLLISLLFEGYGKKKMYVNEKSYDNDTVPLTLDSSIVPAKSLAAERAQNLSKASFDLYRKRFAGKIEDLKLTIYDLLADRGYFRVSPFEQRKPYFAIAGLTMAIPIVVNFYTLIEGDPLMIPWSLVAGLFLASLVIAVIGTYMARATLKGIEKKAYIMGLKEYIQTAEIDRIRFVLENNIDAYKKILPYAGLFNSFQKWIQPLQSIETGIVAADAAKIKDTIGALDVESTITDRKRWPQAILNIFLYGIKLLPKSRRRNDWDDWDMGL